MLKRVSIFLQKKNEKSKNYYKFIVLNYDANQYKLI